MCEGVLCVWGRSTILQVLMELIGLRDSYGTVSRNVFYSDFCVCFAYVFFMLSSAVHIG